MIFHNLTKKAITLLKKDHVFVISYHPSSYKLWNYTETDVEIHYGIFNTNTGVRIAGYDKGVFSNLKRFMHPPIKIPSDRIKGKYTPRQYTIDKVS